MALVNAVPVGNPDLGAVVEVGFTDLKAANGTPNSSRVDWLEVKGQPRPDTARVQSLICSVQDFETTKDLSVDGNLGTRWFAEGEDQWLGARLDDTTYVEILDIAWWKNQERSADFQIEVSMDGFTWQTALARRLSYGIVRDYESYALPENTVANFVRVVGYGNDVNPWNGITEWRILGRPETPHWYSGYPEFNGWRAVAWMGRISVAESPWIYHEEMSWLQVFAGGNGNYAIWDPVVGWMWTAEGWFPYLYSWDKASWFYFLAGPSPRWFYTFKSGEWEVS